VVGREAIAFSLQSHQRFNSCEGDFSSSDQGKSAA
jgi:hypothetical protein